VDVSSRRALIGQLLADPPAVHFMSPEDFETGNQSGVWSTEESCYEFLADRCLPGTRTLETGSGISTVLFAAWGVDHRCVTPGDIEADAIRSYCRARGIPTDRITFDIAFSDTALPRLDHSEPPYDVVLIDGGHGFPAPIIDWYYGGGRLRRGGALVVDDIQLPAVRVLLDFLDRDPRWLQIRHTEKWVAYERQSEGPLGEDWFRQTFFTARADRGWRPRIARIPRRVRAALARVKRAMLTRR
jgi:predicted O-methyltransferase YrrM